LSEFVTSKYYLYPVQRYSGQSSAADTKAAKTILGCS